MLAHSLQFSFLLAVISNYLQHLTFAGFTRKGSHSNRYGPLYLALVASVAVMVMPALFVFQDVGCPVRCVLRDYATVLHATFYSGLAMILYSGAWSMNMLPARS